MVVDPVETSQTVNLYAAPATKVGPPDSELVPSTLDLFWRWEKLRAIYNFILIVEVAAFAGATWKSLLGPDLLRLIL